MKRFIWLTVWTALLLTGCKSGDSSDGNMPHNPFVEAFTSGNVSRFTPVYLIFNKDVGVDDLSDSSLKKHIRIKPEAKGSFTFLNASTIVFNAEHALERNTHYEITADIDAWFKTDKKDARFKFSFTTLPLKLHLEQERFERADDSEELYNIYYSLSTPDREEAKTIEELIRVSEKCDIEWLHNADGMHHSLTVKNIRAGQSKKRDLKISVAPNKLGLAEEELVTTKIPGLNEFEVYDIRYVEEPERYVEVTFTQKLDTKQNLEGLAYIEDNLTSTVYIEGNRLRLYPDANCSGKKNVYLSYYILDARKQRLDPDNDGGLVLEVEISAGMPGIRFKGEGNIIPMSSELVLPFQSIYLRGVIVHVIKVFEHNIGQFLQTNDLSGSENLAQVGRLVARKTIFLDEKSSKLTKWNTFAIRLNELINPEPGAIYRICLSSNIELSLYPCDNAGEQRSKEQILADDEALFKKEAAKFDRKSSYYYYFGNVFNEYDEYYDYDEEYDNRDNPCSNFYYRRMFIEKNILATNLGLISKRGQDGEMIFLVHNLVTTQPEKSVNVSVYNYQRQLIASASTNDKGLARMSIPEGSGLLYYAIASQGQQRAYLQINQGSELSTSSFDVSGETVQKGIKGFIYGERGVWRPGDTLHLGFILNDVKSTLPLNHPVTVELFNPQGQSYIRKTLTQGQLGMYACLIPVESDAPTGAWRANVQVGGASFDKVIRIETIKPNRLKIQLKFPDKTLSKSDKTSISLHTEWLHGAIARNLKYDMSVIFTATKTSFSNYTGYIFDDPTKTFSNEDGVKDEGVTDEKGDAVIETTNLFTDSSAPGMLTANLITHVYEESGDFSVDGVSVPYSPYPAYVGIKSPQRGREVLVTDKDHKFDVVTVTSEGKPLSSSLEVEIFRMQWYWWWDASANEMMANYISEYSLQPVQSLSVSTNSEGKGSFNLNMEYENWGTYLVRVKDRKGGHSTGVLSYFDWPGYGEKRSAQARSESASELGMKLDKESYETGEKATVTFPSPKGSRAIVSIENGSRVISINEYSCTEKETRLMLDVTQDMQPNAYIHITLLQPYNHSSNDLPIRLYGVSPIIVSSGDSHLNPSINTAAEYKPEAPYSITVSEDKGRAMAYTLAILDEGLLDLTRFKTPDPWKSFNAREALGVSTWDMYNFILGAYGGKIEQMFSIGGDDALNKGPKAVVNRFPPVVRFEGPFMLGKGEKKTHTYTMPNYNGRVRVMVVAGNGSAYGNAEKSVPVRKPVMLLATLPRVVGTDEDMIIPATVFATEDNAGSVKVSLSCSNNMQVFSTTQEVNFTKKEDRTVKLKVHTGSRPGTGKITITATAKGEKSTYETDIEIRNVARPQIKIEALTLEAGKSWKGNVVMPGMDGTNSLTLEVSSLPSINLSKRLSYLLGYPHGCLEQITSKAFPQLYLSEFASMTSEQKALAGKSVQYTLNRYRSYFNNGWFTYWPGTSSVNDWAGVYALHFIVEAGNKGYTIPSGIKNTALNSARKAARNWKPGSDKYDEMTQAYRLYVIALAQQAETGAMNRMREIKSLNVTSRRMLGAAYALQGRSDVALQLLSQTTEQQTEYDYNDYTFGSQLRDYGIYLRTLALLPNKEQEATSLAKKISDKLSTDEWLSTQETAFALLGMSAYYSKYTGSNMLGFTYKAGGKSKSVANNYNIWTEKLFGEATSPASLEIKNDGKSTIFIRLLSEGIPKKGEEKAASNSIEVDVQYLDDKDHSIDAARLKQGTNFTAVVTVKNPKAEPLQHLVVSQIFPSGWEIMNTRFLNVENSSEKPDQLTYQDIRDDRVYSYIDKLGGNRHITFRIKLAAIYSGIFYLPPLYCEAMYNGWVQANTVGQTVEVE